MWHPNPHSDESEFRGGVETDFGEILLSHLKYITRVGKEDVAALAVDGHELVFAFFESLESLLIVAFYPACLMERYWLPAALGAILVQQAILYYLELELSHRSYTLAAVELVDK